MERMKILGLFALLGFVAGVAANLAYHKVFPALLKVALQRAMIVRFCFLYR